MLLYNNRNFWRLVLAFHGSIFLRYDNVTMGFILAGVAAILQSLIDDGSEFAPDLPHHYGMHALGTVVTFAVVFRTQLGWQRYWEANTQLHFMYSKWGDAYSQFLAFSSVSIAKASTEGGDEKRIRLKDIIEAVTNNFILLSAISTHRLTHGDMSRMEESVKVVPWSQKVVKREALQRDSKDNNPLPDFTVLQREEGARIKEGVSVPDVVTPASSMTSSIRSSIDRIQNWESPYPIRADPSDEEKALLQKSTDRTAVVNYWLLRDLAKISKDLCIAPPIQTRMYQELSNGMLGFNQCVKLADVPFPFPYAQILTVLLAFYVCFIPVYVVVFTQSMIVGPIMAFALFQGIWGLNETAKELENPFGIDVNDVTLVDFHLRFMEVCDEVMEAQRALSKRQKESNGSETKAR
jgi:predicted membrane chloride channel (bestrophin family)